MANVSVFNMEGNEVGTLELNDAVFGVEDIIAAPLPGGVGDQVRTACRYADAHVKMNALFHAIVQHTRRINAAESAANIHNTDAFHGSASFIIQRTTYKHSHSASMCNRQIPAFVKIADNMRRLSKKQTPAQNCLMTNFADDFMLGTIPSGQKGANPS